MKSFSKDFPTFEEWLSQAPTTEYTLRIKRLHALYPEASLSQLRGHARKAEKPLEKKAPEVVHKRGWDKLSSRERFLREQSLKVLSSMRRDGLSLTRASNNESISPKTVARHTGALRKKKNGRYRATRHDRIERKIRIYESGREQWIIVDDSRYASIIGRYLNAVRCSLEYRDQSFLDPFRGMRVRDFAGRWHTLETDLDAIYEIHEGREDEEFYSIYGD
jgi:hypothetical protein